MFNLSTRARFFLLVHGATAPVTMRGISAYFDAIDGHSTHHKRSPATSTK